MYAQLSHFGASPVNALPVYNNDPLTYCIGDNASQRFNHGSHAVTYGQNSKACQVYMANRCAQNWDGVCEYAASKPANEGIQSGSRCHVLRQPSNHRALSW